MVVCVGYWCAFTLSRRFRIQVSASSHHRAVSQAYLSTAQVIEAEYPLHVIKHSCERNFPCCKPD